MGVCVFKRREEYMNESVYVCMCVCVCVCMYVCTYVYMREKRLKETVFE